MGFRFRKSIKILPGVRVNLSKGGTSISVGGRGASINIGKKGTRTTVGIPGTGLSYSQLHKSTNNNTIPNNPNANTPNGGKSYTWVYVVIAILGFVLFLGK